MTDTTRPDAAGTEWVLVPKVPTEAMLDAGEQAHDDHEYAGRIWSAMLAAASPAPHLAASADMRRQALEEAALIELEFWCETRTEDPVTFSVPAVLAAKGGE